MGAGIQSRKECDVNGTTTKTGAAVEGVAEPVDAADAMIGRRLGPYRLVEVLGHGAFAQVFRAQADGGREVALKLVHASGNQRRQFEEVINEAMASSAVHHPHVVSCLSYGSEGDHLYIVMELAEAGDTHQLVTRDGPLDHQRILRLADQCARGLEAIHAAGLIHRDIKPSNIMLDALGDARIGDLGLVFPAVLADEGMPAAGTPAYMSPEQAHSERLDARTDLYSLGATMYFWATGRAPFKGATPVETIGLVVAGKAPDPREYAPGLPPEVAELIRLAMDPRRGRRFASATLMRGAIAMVATGARPVVPGRVSAPLRTTAASRSAWKTPMLVAGSALLIVSALGWLVPSEHQRSPPARPDSPPTTYTEHRVAWVGDQLVAFSEHGDVRYARAGRQAILAEGTALVCLDGLALLRPLTVAGSGFSVVMSFQVDDLAQQGPARILACGLNHRLVNLMIGQSGSRLEVRCRTTTTNTDGTRPHLVTAEGSLTAGVHHLVFVRHGENHSLWLDGELVASVAVPGSLTAWDASLPLAIGDEARGGFPWAGRIDQLAFVTAPLGSEDVVRRFAAWREERQP